MRFQRHSAPVPSRLGRTGKTVQMILRDLWRDP